ncbi:hypothetical protein OCU04_004028 [Sclerotinia nivalis]|uniref:Uncharacterized protein n=1 Tax=Sclerotinia nivalis TaxID=352851 RepID=A0A9X0AT76_9HELO|nr:hypothetical protein OCU04_004028 [Sclerotinia nivalis]
MGFSRGIPDVIPPQKPTLPSSILEASTPSERTLPPIIPIKTAPSEPASVPSLNTVIPSASNNEKPFRFLGLPF